MKHKVNVNRIMARIGFILSEIYNVNIRRITPSINEIPRDFENCSSPLASRENQY
tara:strand:- start:68 stop:232 length:165 start_codon:yes stop_codon:yes gene_type:complete